jgi:two-component system cell cycle sensor histidine kinase/response regulator CckA
MDLQKTTSMLRILYVEDNENDRVLVAAALHLENIHAEFIYATNEEQFRDGLQMPELNLILSDFTLPGFSGATALRIARELRPDVPFVYVSGTIGEEQAVESLKSGATDYALKDHMERLAAVIQRALRESQQIADRNQAEEALRASEERFRQIAENLEEVLWLTDPSKASMLYISPAYERIWGRSCQSLYDEPRSWLDAIVSEDRERVLESAHTEQVLGKYKEEYRIVRPNGEIRWISDRAFPIFDAAGRPYRVAGVATDITERKQLERQFIRAQRMETLGSLAGGVAHDLNNALAPVLMGIEVLRDKFQDADSRMMLDIVLTSAQRGADIVRQLLTFSRGFDGKHLVVPVRHLVREIEGILRQTFPKNIRIRIEVSKNVWGVIGDVTQMHQVLLNLSVNARDAMPQGGTLTITAANFLVDEHFASMRVDARPGPHVILSVVDTGTGIPPEIRGQIFDPFFTTKPIDKGTGLGLSTVRGIVKNHGGFIAVQSEVGVGSEFKIFLPAKEGPALNEQREEPADLPSGQGELILVVDDEEAIRTLTQRTLESFNYRVLTAGNGAEAMALCAREGKNIRLMLTDIAMPVMDGAALIAGVRSLFPKLKIIASSGLEQTSNGNNHGPSGADGYLQKPFTAERLLKTIREWVPV